MIRVPPAEAIAQIVWTLSWAGGEMPIHVNASPEPTMRLRNPGIAERLARRAHELDLRDSAEVAAGLPLTKAGSTVLWAWICGGEQEQRAHRFRKPPSIVLRIGGSSERLLLWGMREPVPLGRIESANAKLAYALHAARTRSRPDQLLVPMPGTFKRIGRKRPAAVVVTRMELGEWTLQSLVGRLRDPPAPYMQRLRNGEVSR